TLKALTALYYRTTNLVPTRRSVSTMIPSHADSEAELDAFPSFEMVLGMKYKVHNCWVVWQSADGRVHRYLVGFQRRSDLPANAALCAAIPGCHVHGELVVMRGKKGNSLMSIRGAESHALALEAVKRSAQSLYLPRPKAGS
ncbi:hypothetical protein BC835DRAFT_1290943, partial [Cytidiella melzeri]